LVQKIGPKNWSKKLVQKIGPKNWSKQLVQTIGPKNWSKVQKIGSKNWSKNCIGTKVTQKLKNSKKSLDARQRHESRFLEAPLVRQEADTDG
jgi:hypothetical protein